MKTNEDEKASTPLQTTFRFPVGYHQLHDDPFLNFEMNRPFNRVGDETKLSDLGSPSSSPSHAVSRQVLLFA